MNRVLAQRLDLAERELRAFLRQRLVQVLAGRAGR